MNFLTFYFFIFFFQRIPVITPYGDDFHKIIISWGLNEEKICTLYLWRSGDNFRKNIFTVKPDGRNYHIVLKGLEHGEYKFSIGDYFNDTFSFKLWSFKDSFVFLILGDTRSNYAVHKRLVDRVISSRLSFDFVIHTGDFVWRGAMINLWEKFFDIEKPLFRAYYLPCVGNHETYGIIPPLRNGLEVYNKIFPVGGTYYLSFDSLFIFVFLNSDGDIDKQAIYLDSILSLYDYVRWRLVVFHRPLVSSGYMDKWGKCWNARLYRWRSVIEGRGVDMVINGHVHSYERIGELGGIWYVVVGGGGAPLYKIKNKCPFSKKLVRTYHYALLVIKRDKIKLKVYDLDGKLIDKFILRK